MWPVSELQYLDRQTRKLLTMSRALHPRTDVDHLYMPRSRGVEALKVLKMWSRRSSVECMSTLLIVRIPGYRLC